MSNHTYLLSYLLTYILNMRVIWIISASLTKLHAAIAAML